MKVLAATLASLLLLATCTPAEGHLDGVPTKCCFTYQKNPIPQRLVRSVFDTSSSCSKPGVIMITLKKRELCADPQEKWVQDLQKHFQSLGN